MKLISRVKTVVAVSYGGGTGHFGGGVGGGGFSETTIIVGAKRCDPKIKCNW